VMCMDKLTNIGRILTSNRKTIPREVNNCEFCEAARLERNERPVLATGTSAATIAVIVQVNVLAIASRRPLYRTHNYKHP